MKKSEYALKKTLEEFKEKLSHGGYARYQASFDLGKIIEESPVMGDENDSRIEKALEDTNVPKIYCNGFVNTMGIGDLVLVLEKNGEACSVVNMPYSTAKSFAKSINTLIKGLEIISQQGIMPSDEIKELLEKK